MDVRSLGVGVLLTAAAATLLAQRPADTPQFRAGIELIQLDVAVLDDQRQPVRGLTAQEFTVLDNGVATPIRAFTPIELDAGPRASDAVWARDLPPDVVTNRVGEQDGRLVIILMDRSIPVEQPTITARKIASAAVAALGPGDLAAVVSTSGGAIQNLTSDRTRLLRAINAGDPSTGLSPEQEATMFGKLDPLQDPRCSCGLCVLETITRVAEAVQDTPRRRKALLFIGTSVIWQASRPVAAAGSDVGCEGRLRDARTHMFTAVDRANLTVHSIDPQGLVNTGPQVRAGIGGGFDRPVNSGPEVRLRQQQSDTNQIVTSRQSLQVLPERTGGRTVAGRNNPDQIVPAIFRESEAYYVLGVERAASDRPDRERTLEVKVARKGLRAYFQRKYVASAQPQFAGAASDAGQSSSTESALTSLLPNAGLPLALYATAFAGPDSAASVVRVGVDAGAFARADGGPVPLEIAVAAVDATGRPQASVRQTSTISGVAPASGGRGEFYVPSHLTLAPGEYGIRVAVSDPSTGKVASVFSDLTVPKFDSARLSLSGLNVELSNAPPAPPVTTMRRLFRRTDAVRAVLQIYQGTQRTDPLAPVSVRVQILDARGSAVRDQTLPFSAQTFTNRRADCVITLPLATLPQGAYLLKLDVSLEGEAIGRALPFTVE